MVVYRREYKLSVSRSLDSARHFRRVLYPRLFDLPRSRTVDSDPVERWNELCLDGRYQSSFSVKTRSYVRSFVRMYFPRDYLLLLSVTRNIVGYVVDISVKSTETWSFVWETVNSRVATIPRRGSPNDKPAKRTFSETRGLERKDNLFFASYFQGGHHARFAVYAAITHAILLVTRQMLIFVIYTTLFLLHAALLPFSPCIIAFCSLFFSPPLFSCISVYLLKILVIFISSSAAGISRY